MMMKWRMDAAHHDQQASVDCSFGFLSVGLWFRYFSLFLLSTVYGRYHTYHTPTGSMILLYRTCHFRVLWSDSSFVVLSFSQSIIS
jgi:hypothetical protein